MAKFVVVTDACSDLPKDIVQKNNVPVISLNLHFGDQTVKTASMTNADFYGRLRKKQVAKTSQPNETEVAELIEPLLKKGQDVLAIIISSVLSGTFNSFRLAKETLKAKYPERKFVLIDSQQVSLGISYLVIKALEWANAGKTLEETAAAVEKLVPQVNAIALLDELGTLQRGGRLSATKAFLGTLLNFKPILAISNEGRLKATNEKGRGRVNGMAKLAEMVKQRLVNDEIILIAHSDAPADAKKLGETLKTMFPKNKQLITNELGPVIAAHAGLGALAVIFLGKDKPVIS
jgi:DegV family protein with EDD domain